MPYPLVDLVHQTSIFLVDRRVGEKLAGCRSWYAVL